MGSTKYLRLFFFVEVRTSDGFPIPENFPSQNHWCDLVHYGRFFWELRATKSMVNSVNLYLANSWNGRKWHQPVRTFLFSNIPTTICLNLNVLCLTDVSQHFLKSLPCLSIFNVNTTWIILDNSTAANQSARICRSEKLYKKGRHRNPLFFPSSSSEAIRIHLAQSQIAQIAQIAQRAAEPPEPRHGPKVLRRVAWWAKGWDLMSWVVRLYYTHVYIYINIVCIYVNKLCIYK